MKIVKIILLILLVAFVGIQFIPTERNQSDIVLKTDFMLVNLVPNNIKSKLQVSCYDCHSNNTAYPWYNKIPDRSISSVPQHSLVENKDSSVLFPFAFYNCLSRFCCCPAALAYICLSFYGIFRRVRLTGIRIDTEEIMMIP